MKKICHLSSVHARYDTRIFVKMCSSLADSGFDVTLVIADGKGDEIKNGVKISDVGPKSSRIKRMITTVNQVYNRALEIDADVYHFHDPELLRIATKLKRKGKKVIYDVHEDVPRQVLAKNYLNKNIRFILSKLIEKYENKVASKLDAIITATPHIANRYLKMNKNTIDVNNFPIIQELLIEMDYLEKKEDTICYIGAIATVRGLKEVVSSLPDSKAKLNLAGPFNEVGLETALKGLDGWEKVNYLGFASRDQIREIFRNSKVGMVTLHPIINYLDSLPVKMFEYMAAGLPVVASNFPYWESIVLKNNVGLCVDPKNPKQIAEAVNWLLDNPEEAKKMGENGKEAVKKVFNWDREKIKLIDVYNKILNNQL